MPLNGAGTAAKPAGSTAVSNTTIESSKMNSVIDDIYSIFNTARPLAYGGTGGTSQITGWDGLSAKGTDIASAGTINLTTATGPRIDITGTTTITAVTLAAGSIRIARATGIFQITASASLLVNKSASVNYTTAVGDLLIFIADSTVVSVTTIGSVAAATTSAAGIVELATAAEFRTGTDTGRALVVDQVWSSAAEVTLTDAATIAVDGATFLNAVVTLGGNRTLGTWSNPKAGQSGYIRVVQDGAGSRTLAYHADYEFAGGSAPTLSTAIAAQDMLFYQVIASGRVLLSIAKAIS